MIMWCLWQANFKRKAAVCKTTTLVLASINLKPQRNIPPTSFSSFLGVSKYHTWPWWTLTHSVYIVGAGLSNNMWDGWEIKPHTFSHYSRKECRPSAMGERESLDRRSQVGPTLTVISGLVLRLEEGKAKRSEGCVSIHASTVKEVDLFEVVQLSLTWRCHSNLDTS